MKSATNEDKKRSSVFSQIARKRSRAARVSSSGEKQVSKGTSDEEGRATRGAVVENPVPSKSVGKKSINTSPSDPCKHSKMERMDSSKPAPKEWSCEKCTLVNPLNRKRCEACKARKPIVTSSLGFEQSDSPSPRPEFATPAKIDPLHVKKGTSINVKLAEKLDTPKTSKANDSPMFIERDPDANGRNHRRPSSVDIHENDRSKENDDGGGGNVLQIERSSSADPTKTKPSDRDESENTIKDAQSQQAPHDDDTPIFVHEHYHELQVMLARVLDELGNMKDEIKSLREQNKELLLNQKQLLDENPAMKITLSSLESGKKVGRSHSKPDEAEASVIHDTSTRVSPDASHADDEHLLTNGGRLKESKATATGSMSSHVLKGGKQIDSPAVEPTLNLVNADDQPRKESAERPSSLSNQKESNAKNLLPTPLSPAMSSQTFDPDASSQLSVPSKVSFPKNPGSDRLLKNCTNQNLPKLAAWTTTKKSRHFMAEMDSDIPKVAAAPWMTTRPKLNSTAPFRSATDQNQDTFLDGPNYAYNETVRCRKDRNGLPCHDCDECRKWYLTLKRTGHEFSQDPLAFSRHRSRFQPHESPVDFWEMSFVDERKARQADEAERKAREVEEAEK